MKMWKQIVKYIGNMTPKKVKTDKDIETPHRM